MLTRVLNSDEQTAIVGRKTRPAQLRTDRRAQKVPRQRPLGTHDFADPQAVGDAELIGTIGRYPEPAATIEGTIVRRRKPAMLADIRMIIAVVCRFSRIAGQNEQLPAEFRCGMIAVGRQQFEDMTVRVGSARIGRRHGLALRVAGCGSAWRIPYM